VKKIAILLIGARGLFGSKVREVLGKRKSTAYAKDQMLQKMK
jgi:hypothetical protein